MTYQCSKKTLKIFYLFLVLILCENRAGAVICIPAKVTNSNNGAEFFSAVVSYLGSMENGLQENEKARIFANNMKTGWLTHFIFATKEANLNYKCAIGHISGFKKSTDQLISASAEALTQSAQDLSTLNLSRLEKIKSTVDGRLKSNETRSTYAEFQAKTQIKIKEAWELLLVATQGATHAVLAKSTDSQGRIYKLNITSVQRSNFIKRLENIKGKFSQQEDIDYPVLAARELKNFLTEGWSSSDKK